MSELNDIHPVFDKIAGRRAKEHLLRQKAVSVWLIGLSGAGKTTVGIELEQRMIAEGFLTQILDGDNIRAGINKNLKFTEEDREENIRRIAEVNKLFLNCGIITINCFINPTHETRRFTEQILGKDDIVTVYINTPIAVCEQRDIKGLYRKARQGLIKNFTGIDSPFEEPENPNVIIDTSAMNVGDSAQKIFDYLKPIVKSDFYERVV